MFDIISLERLEKLHPAIRQAATECYKESYAKGVNLRITRTLATFQEQDQLYKQGRTIPGPIVTWAKGGQSYHNYGLALDFCLLDDDEKHVSWDRNRDLDQDHIADWMEVVMTFTDHGFEAGINWPKPKQDPPHFQMMLGYSIAKLQVLHNDRKVDRNGYIILGQ